jgi:integrase-like protein/reverse transcriptase-like protein
MDKDGRRRPARYGSLPINEREANYSQAKLELYGLFRALRHFRVHIIGVKNLVVEVDAKYIKGMINQPDMQPNATMNRWIYGILLFNFVLRHVPAQNHAGPDGLSRRPRAEDDSEDEDTAEAADEWIDNLLDYTIHTEDVQTKQTQAKFTFAIHEAELESIQHFLTTLQPPRFTSVDQKKNFLNKAKRFYMEDGKMYRRSKHGPLRVVFKRETRTSLLTHSHDKIGHKGVYGIFQTLSRRFWWPNLAADVRAYVKSCHQCQIRSTKKLEVPLTVSTPATIFTKVYLDMMLMPAKGRSKKLRYIIAARDDLTGAAVGRKLEGASARKVAQFILEEVIYHYGHIGEIVTDNGPETKAAFEELLRRFGIPHVRISPYNSKANGVVEQGHFHIRQAILKLCEDNPSKWTEYVPQAFFADRVTTRKATGFSPFYLLHGVDPVLPFDLAEATYLVSGFTKNMTTADLLALRIKQLTKKESDVAKAAQTIARSRYRSKEEFERRYHKRFTGKLFKKGQLVLVRNSKEKDSLQKKFKPRYLGPFEVIRQTKGGSYVLKELDGTISRRGVAAFRLLPYFSREGQPISPDQIMTEGLEEESSEESDGDPMEEDESNSDDDSD